MLKNLVFSLMFLIVCTGTSRAQECMGFTFKAGSGFDMDSFDGKGKPNGKITYKIASVTNEGGKTLITVDFESFDNKGKSQIKNLYKMRCDGNALTLDASSLINPEQMKVFAGFEMKFTSEDIVYPATFSVGETLKDASLKGEGASGSLPVIFSMLISNRKVQSQEKITTPAGTFDTYKITSDMNMQTKMGLGIKMELNAVSYRAPGVIWDVKTETYRKGKLMGTTELTKVY
jgi:hypothetical protein